MNDKIQKNGFQKENQQKNKQQREDLQKFIDNNGLYDEDGKQKHKQNQSSGEQQDQSSGIELKKFKILQHADMKLNLTTVDKLIEYLNFLYKTKLDKQQKIQSNSSILTNYENQFSSFLQKYKSAFSSNSTSQLSIKFHQQFRNLYLKSKQSIKLSIFNKLSTSLLPKFVITDHFSNQLIVQNIIYSKHYEVVELKVHYLWFKTNICILNNLQVSPLHTCAKVSCSGSFGNVYFVKNLQEQIAIKCILFEKPISYGLINQLNNETKRFKQILKEYFFLLLFSELQIGPQIKTIGGFDLVFYSNCLEFATERCTKLNAQNDYQSQLKQSIKIMHALQIVHRDIKPANILYSPTFKKNVFIDFGGSQALNEFLGQKTTASFLGTISYCSQQILSLINKKKQDVDLYYNDIYGLQKTLYEKQSQQSRLYKQQYSLESKQLLDENIFLCNNQNSNTSHLVVLKIKHCIYKKDQLQFKHLWKILQLKYNDQLLNGKLSLLRYFFQFQPNQTLIQFYQNQIEQHIKDLQEFQEIKKLFRNHVYKSLSNLIFFQRKAMLYEFHKIFYKAMMLDFGTRINLRQKIIQNALISRNNIQSFINNFFDNFRLNQYYGRKLNNDNKLSSKNSEKDQNTEYSSLQTNQKWQTFCIIVQKYCTLSQNKYNVPINKKMQVAQKVINLIQKIKQSSQYLQNNCLQKNQLIYHRQLTFRIIQPTLNPLAKFYQYYFFQFIKHIKLKNYLINSYVSCLISLLLVGFPIYLRQYFDYIEILIFQMKISRLKKIIIYWLTHIVYDIFLKYFLNKKPQITGFVLEGIKFQMVHKKISTKLFGKWIGFDDKSTQKNSYSGPYQQKQQQQQVPPQNQNIQQTNNRDNNKIRHKNSIKKIFYKINYTIHKICIFFAQNNNNFTLFKQSLFIKQFRNNSQQVYNSNIIQQNIKYIQKLLYQFNKIQNSLILQSFEQQQNQQQQQNDPFIKNKQISIWKNITFYIIYEILEKQRYKKTNKNIIDKIFNQNHFDIKSINQFLNYGMHYQMYQTNDLKLSRQLKFTLLKIDQIIDYKYLSVRYRIQYRLCDAYQNKQIENLTYMMKIILNQCETESLYNIFPIYHTVSALYSSISQQVNQSPMISSNMFMFLNQIYKLLQLTIKLIQKNHFIQKLSLEKNFFQQESYKTINKFCKTFFQIAQMTFFLRRLLKFFNLYRIIYQNSQKEWYLKQIIMNFNFKISKQQYKFFAHLSTKLSKLLEQEIIQNVIQNNMVYILRQQRPDFLNRIAKNYMYTRKNYSQIKKTATFVQKLFQPFQAKDYMKNKQIYKQNQQIIKRKHLQKLIQLNSPKIKNKKYEFLIPKIKFLPSIQITLDYVCIKLQQTIFQNYWCQQLKQYFKYYIQNKNQYQLFQQIKRITFYFNSMVYTQSTYAQIQFLFYNLAKFIKKHPTNQNILQFNLSLQSRFWCKCNNCFPRQVENWNPYQFIMYLSRRIILIKPQQDPYMAFIYYNCFINQPIDLKTRRKFVKFIHDSFPFITSYARQLISQKLHQILVPLNNNLEHDDLKNDQNIINTFINLPYDKSILKDKKFQKTNFYYKKTIKNKRFKHFELQKIIQSHFFKQWYIKDWKIPYNYKLIFMKKLRKYYEVKENYESNQEIFIYGLKNEKLLEKYLNSDKQIEHNQSFLYSKDIKDQIIKKAEQRYQQNKYIVLNNEYLFI